MVMTHALINFSLSTQLGVWGMTLGLRGKGMLSSRKISCCYVCRVSVAVFTVCVDACTSTCEFNVSVIMSCMDTCTCIHSSAHSLGTWPMAGMLWWHFDYINGTM